MHFDLRQVIVKGMVGKIVVDRIGESRKKRKTLVEITFIFGVVKLEI